MMIISMLLFDKNSNKIDGVYKKDDELINGKETEDLYDDNSVKLDGKYKK